jgi:hypothetical protein
MKTRALFMLLTILYSTTYATETKAIDTNQITLQSFLRSSSSGDYIVTQSGSLTTLIMIRSLSDKSVVLEEISVPAKKIKEKPCWDKWVKSKAPGHTSWSIVEISLQDSQILDCYSFSRGAHIQISQKESLIATLLQLPLKEVQTENRRKIGPPPQEGERDYRKPWQPPYFFEGKATNNPEFSVFETIWPCDETELSERKVTLYFDREMKIPFPCWIDLETSHAIGRFQVIDSGKKLISPQRMIPRQS